MNKVLVFDIFGEYAHFRKYFTNMSPTTFIIPPRTVIAGIIGAIIGIDKSENPEKFLLKDSLIAVGLKREVNKVVMQINGVKATSLSNLTMPLGMKRQINYEFVKNPLYRIYFSHNDDELYNLLKNRLEMHESTYTIALGSAQCLANYEYIGEFDLSEVESEDYINIQTAISLDNLIEIDFTGNNKIQKSIMPNEMLNDRTVTKYEEFIYSISGATILAKTKKVYSINKLGEFICAM
ncbi:type I-B CRISPR-associated protein Cas5 [bacterium]|nr:type I-B CRISPR-associated protein Cas5 [bacterium]